VILKTVLHILLFCLISAPLSGRTLKVGKGHPYKAVRAAIAAARNYDTVMVHTGSYREGNIILDKSVALIGTGWPVLDGEKKHEVLSVKAHSATVSGFRIVRSGYASLDDPCGIKVYDAHDVNITNNILEDNFFAVYIQFGKRCAISGNTVTAYGKDEQMIGNGIHCWKSDSLTITANRIKGHRDGIYFEFVTNSMIEKNLSEKNVRYGLHFMFSNNDAYIGNEFRNNGAGVAVMFTRKVTMKEYSNRTGAMRPTDFCSRRSPTAISAGTVS
jgi:nitrous oxidase accessory protein